MDIDITLYLQRGLDFLLSIIPSIASAIAVLVIGFWIANKADDLLEKALDKSNLSAELKSFFGSMLTIVIKAFVLLTAAGMVGIETASLVAVLAAAGFAVGFALQGSLSNFAAGILILIFRPFRVGDWIASGDFFGKVESIQILNTIIVSPGKKTIIIPNADITGGVVTNYSAQGVIRLELEVPMAYESSYPEVHDIILKVLQASPFVKSDPAPEVGIENYDSHNIILTARPFVDPDHYWDATYAINGQIKAALSENGIPMAYSEGVELGKIGA